MGLMCAAAPSLSLSLSCPLCLETSGEGAGPACLLPPHPHCVGGGVSTAAASGGWAYEITFVPLEICIVTRLWGSHSASLEGSP